MSSNVSANPISHPLRKALTAKSRAKGDTDSEQLPLLTIAEKSGISYRALHDFRNGKGLTLRVADELAKYLGLVLIPRNELRKLRAALAGQSPKPKRAVAGRR